MKANNKYLAHVLKVTQKGEERLDEVLTDSKGDVYAFRGTESPVLVAAAMARLSRRGDDMRITYLDEFADAAGGADDLIKRVVTAYGDDSVQQLVGVHVVVENASDRPIQVGSHYHFAETNAALVSRLARVAARLAGR